MSSLDNLVSKIIKDSHDKGSAIIKDAQESADKLIESRVSEATRVKNDMIEQGRREAETQKSLIVSAKRIEIRDELLKTKQGLIEKAFKMSVDKLNSLSQDEYLNFLEKYLLELDLDGDEEIVVPEAYSGISLSKINEKLSKSGKKGLLTLGTGAKSGFLVLKNGVENNNTYEALLDYYRDDLEKVVAENLF